MGELKRAVYARMEEVSFRSGAAAAGGVLTAAGVAITLAVTLGGGPSDAVTTAPAARAATPSAATPSAGAPSSAPAFSSPQATPRPSRSTVPATVAGDYQPPTATRASAARASAARHAATTPVSASTRTPSPSGRQWRPGHRHLREQPGWWGRHRPSAAGSRGHVPRHRRR